MFKLDLEKAEEQEMKLPTSLELYEKQENSRKTSTSASLTMLNPFTVWITTNCGKFLKRWEYQTTYLTCLLRNLYAGEEATVRTGHGTTGWFQIGKGVSQGCIYCHLVYLTYIQSTSCETVGMKHKPESRSLGEISIISDMQVIPPLWQKAKRN